MNDKDRQAMEIASEHDFDRSIDHSQPHEPTDMERELNSMFDDFDDEDRYIGTMPTIAELDGLTFEEELRYDNPGYRPCRCEDYPCCGH